MAFLNIYFLGFFFSQLSLLPAGFAKGERERSVFTIGLEKKKSNELLGSRHSHGNEYKNIVGEKAKIEGQKIRQHRWLFLPGIVFHLRSSCIHQSTQHWVRFKHIILVCNPNLLACELKESIIQNCSTTP